jgi:hypothetical protein
MEVFAFQVLFGSFFLPNLDSDFRFFSFNRKSVFSDFCFQHLELPV